VEQKEGVRKEANILMETTATKITITAHQRKAKKGRQARCPRKKCQGRKK
jgi:hypothetical protein